MTNETDAWGNQRNIIALIMQEKRVICVSVFIALAQFQYGYDSAAVSGFQSMPGFLAVFGYVDVSTTGTKG